MTSETQTLFRPVGPKELDLIAEAAWRRFPPRLPEQPIFYPVLNEEYAREITRKWNVTEFGIGHVVRFSVHCDYASRFPVRNVGDKTHVEIWVPTEQLNEFNEHIVGEIELVATYTVNDMV